MRGPRIHPERSIRHQGVLIFIRDGDSWGKDLVMEKVPENTAASPTMIITDEAAQELFDDLWDQGLRPSGTRDGTMVSRERAAIAQVIAAKNEHLQDLRDTIAHERTVLTMIPSTLESTLEGGE